MQEYWVWFRNDLRISDHEPLLKASAAADRSGGTVRLIYVFDPRFYERTSFGFPRMGPHRQRFLRQSLADLERAAGQLGGKLEWHDGHAEEVFQELVEQTLRNGNHVAGVYFHRDFASEEKSIERKVIKRLRKLEVSASVSEPQTLYSLEDLPFTVAELPEVFSKFRRGVEKKCQIPKSLGRPQSIPATSRPIGNDSGRPIEQCERLHALPEPEFDQRGVLEFEGGETAGLRRLNDYFWGGDCLREYKQTRNGMLGANYSSKFSPWLALGCLSARQIRAEVIRYEAERVKNDSTYWMVFELIWRDYFQFIVGKHGSNVFQLGGLRQQRLPWKQDWERFEAWCDGRTGFPLIDANMRELAATGFMSNRGRQNVASFLTKNLGIDWRMGAEWFESMLIDYDPCSNYGNWNYTAGVGNDARGFRWFNTLKQAHQYDPDGAYVRHWLPELKDVPSKHVHQPWEMHQAEQKRSNCMLGVDYPNPIVDLFKSVEKNEQAYEEAMATHG
jgi:deoxyribodipyrimidine photo-lyase